MLAKPGQGGTLDALPHVPHVPHAILTPAFEAPPHRCGRAILARKILPLTARAEHLWDALDDATIVGSWPAWWYRRWE